VSEAARARASAANISAPLAANNARPASATGVRARDSGSGGSVAPRAGEAEIDDADAADQHHEPSRWTTLAIG
jgi:hypothetical protein